LDGKRQDAKVDEHEQDEDSDEHGSGDSDDAHPLAAALLMLTSDLPARWCRSAQRSYHARHGYRCH
jgi:hypothetical protein